MNGKFVWDDIPLIRDNVYIRDFSYVKDIFTKDLGAGSGGESNFYRPFYIFTYSINYFFSKLNLKSLHLTNIALHILAALAVYWLIFIFYDKRLVSLLASIFFLTHPVHTEAVSYMSGRVDSLVTLFMLLSFIFYTKNLYAKNTIFYMLMSISYITALLSKENALILPALVMLYHFSFSVSGGNKHTPGSSKSAYGKEKKRGIIAFISLIAISIVYVAFRLVVLRSALLPLSYPSSIFHRLPGFFATIVDYIRILLFPVGLHMEYGNELFQFANIKTISGAIVLAALLIYAFRKKENSPLVFFAVFWFFITLLPVSNLYPVAFYMAEHYLYLPSIGFFLLLAHWFTGLYAKKEFKTYTIIAAAGLTGIYSYLTIGQNNYWREPIRFYERTLKYAKNSSRVYNNLANCYRDAGRTEEAVILYKKAIEIDPVNADAYNNLAITLRNSGKTEEAMALYKKAIEINPRHPNAYGNLGIAFYSSGKIANAISAYKKAIEINPHAADVFYNLGVAYGAIGKGEEAIDSYRKAVKINPDDADIYNNLGNEYNNKGRIKEAIASYGKAIELNPDSAVLHNNLGLLYYKEEEYRYAVKYLDKAFELGHKVNPEIIKFLESYRK